MAIQVSPIKKASKIITGETIASWCLTNEAGETIGGVEASAQGIQVQVNDWIYEKSDLQTLIKQLLVAMDEYDSLRPQLSLFPS